MAITDMIPLALQTYNYISGSDDARDITEPMNDAYNKGLDEVGRTFDPYVEKGQGALNRWDELLADPSSITDNPGYQFGLGEGQKALERSAGSDLLSGNTLLDVNKYAQDYGQTYYDKALGREADMAKTGLDAGKTSAPLKTGLYEEQAQGYATREALQNANRDTTIRGLTSLLPGQGGVNRGGGGGSPVSSAIDAGGDILSSIGNIFSGGGNDGGDGFFSNFADDFGNLVSGSLFDPDTWGDMFDWESGGGWDVGGAFWDGMGEIADFFQ